MDTNNKTFDQNNPGHTELLGDAVVGTESSVTLKGKPTRDEIRAGIFNAKPKSEVVTDFFGFDVEIRQPELGVILATRQEDESNQVARMLTDYTYVPETNDKVFEREDVEAIQRIPFGPEMKRYIDKMNELLGVDPKDTVAGIDQAKKS